MRHSRWAVLTEDQIDTVWNRHDKTHSGVPKEKLGGVIEECLFLTAGTMHQIKAYPPGSESPPRGGCGGEPTPPASSIAADITDDMREMQGETKRLLLHLVRANKDGRVSKKEFMQRWNEYGERLYTAKTCAIL